MSALIPNNEYQFPTLGSDDPDAIRLGRFADSDLRTITGRMGYGGQRNLLVFGPNESGKGMRLLVPNLLQTRGRSIFVIDPKGELAAITAPYRRTLGEVVIINPFGLMTNLPGYADMKSSGYNPLAKLNPELHSFNREAAQLAEALVTIGGNDPHWDASARALLAAIIMYVVMEARNKLTPAIAVLAGVGYESLFQRKGVPTMARVRELLCLASDAPSAANDFRGVGIPALALAMMQTSVAGLRNKASQFTTWSREVQSIASAAKRHTEAFDDDEIAEDLSKDGFRLSDMKKRPVTVYLLLHPDLMERHSKWLRLVVTAALQSVMRPREPGEPKVLFMLDEFAALGHMEIIETVWALVRGYGIQILPVFQDINQLRTIYKERWQTFIAQAGVVTSFAPNDSTTADWISERAGDTERIVESFNRSSSTTHSEGQSSGPNSGTTSSGVSTTESSSLSSQPTKVRFVQSHSLYGMHPGATVSFLAGLSNIVPGYAPPYWDIDECVSRARENPYHATSRNNSLPPPSPPRVPYSSVYGERYADKNDETYSKPY
jgi:type IV secretion system protein VirD4